MNMRVLFDSAAIAARNAQLAGDIAKLMPAEFVAVGVLKGSFVFLADLMRALDAVGMRPEVEFMRLSSYGGARESAGVVRLLGEPAADLAERDVLLVDDIADTGVSLTYAHDFLLARGAARVRTCVLLDKPARRRVAFAPDFVGFTVQNEFVVGYGLDDAERFRHLPYLAVIDEA